MRPICFIFRHVISFLRPNVGARELMALDTALVVS